MSNTTNNASRMCVSFAAIEPYIERTIPKPTESHLTGRDWVRWGRDNKYPEFLLDLYNTVPDLRAAVDACADYIAGDDVLFRDSAEARVNPRTTARDITRDLGWALNLYGAFAIQVIRNTAGEPVELHALDIRHIRMNKDCKAFWYSERWNKSSADPDPYPEFLPGLQERWATLSDEERSRATASIYYYKEDRSQVYPSPCYRAAIPSCEIQRNIDIYHLSALDNGFAPSAIINFNNGRPTDEDKAELERAVNEKFAGCTNGARIMMSFNDSKDNAVTVVPFRTEDFGERYQALAKTSRQKIFTAFRANPNIFGIPTESLGFSSEEYDQAFKLFNRTHIKPAQRVIADAFASIYGEPVLTIKPFTLEGTTETDVR